MRLGVADLTIVSELYLPNAVVGKTMEEKEVIKYLFSMSFL